MGGRLFVLIVSNNPRLEWLALCAVRAAGCLPMLGHPDEESPDALRRTRPDVVLLDTAHPCATSAVFYADATELGARVIPLAPVGREGQTPEVAGRQSACCVTLPTEYGQFATALARVDVT